MTASGPRSMGPPCEIASQARGSWCWRAPGTRRSSRSPTPFALPPFLFFWAGRRHSTGGGRRRPRNPMSAGWLRLAVTGLILVAMTAGPSTAVAQTASEPSRSDQAPATGPGSPTWRGESEFVRSPNDAPLPPLPAPQQGLLESNFPSLRDTLGKLPPFFRDIDVNVRLRSFYFNRQNDNDTASEAWTLGGWVSFASGWLFDTFAMGATYYASFPAYAPADRPGSLTLTPGQGEIGVFGEAWGALRYKDYALLKGYRLRIDEGY